MTLQSADNSHVVTVKSCVKIGSFNLETVNLNGRQYVLNCINHSSQYPSHRSHIRRESSSFLGSWFSFSSVGLAVSSDRPTKIKIIKTNYLQEQ